MGAMALFGCGHDRDRQLGEDHQRAVYESLAQQDALQGKQGVWSCIVHRQIVWCLSGTKAREDGVVGLSVCK
jgi:hypothetical protein